MNNISIDCPICGMEMDDNHFAPASFPGIDVLICCNCEENLSLMFTNFEERPSGDSYIVPDNSDKIEQITGRSYLENRLLYFLDCIRYRQTNNNPADAATIDNLKTEVEKIKMAIKKGNR